MKKFLLFIINLFIAGCSCSVEFNPKSKIDSIGYQKILPIFINRCSACHNPGVPERNWLDYKTAFSKKDMIKSRLIGRTMPPSGLPLLDNERELVIEWVNQGAKK